MNPQTPLHRLLAIVMLLVLILPLSLTLVPTAEARPRPERAQPDREDDHRIQASELPTGEISITTAGMLPETITVTAGANVIWTNDTGDTVTLVGRWPYEAYLPIVLKSTNSGFTSLVDSGTRSTTTVGRSASRSIPAQSRSMSRCRRFRE